MSALGKWKLNLLKSKEIKLTRPPPKKKKKRVKYLILGTFIPQMLLSGRLGKAKKMITLKKKKEKPENQKLSKEITNSLIYWDKFLRIKTTHYLDVLEVDPSSMINQAQTITEMLVALKSDSQDSKNIDQSLLLSPQMTTRPLPNASGTQGPSITDKMEKTSRYMYSVKKICRW